MKCERCGRDMETPGIYCPECEKDLQNPQDQDVQETLDIIHAYGGCLD